MAMLFDGPIIPGHPRKCMTQEIDNIGAAIIKGVCNPETKDFAVDLGDLELDALLGEGVLKEIPYIKFIISLHKSWTAIHDQLFLRKVATFMLSSTKFTHEQGEKFIHDYLQNPEDAKRLSDAIVLILDKLDDMEKPQMVAKAFEALVRNEFGFETFRRLATAIEIGFLDDLREFSKSSSNNSPQPVSRFQEHPKLVALNANLLRTGLVEINRGSGMTAIARVGYKVSELGQIFKKCMNAA
jgi:hypothetical protein